MRSIRAQKVFSSYKINVPMVKNISNIINHLVAIIRNEYLNVPVSTSGKDLTTSYTIDQTMRVELWHITNLALTLPDLLMMGL